MKIPRVCFILLACTTACQAYLYIADRSLTRMIQLTSEKPYCYYYTDKKFIEKTIPNVQENKIKLTTTEEIQKLCDVCREKRLQTSYQGGFIYPGTKWCGPGASAANYDELGNHRREDMCCRDHDNCAVSLERGECKQGLCNKSLFTRSHCDCDETFQKCLRAANSETANTIGAIFFNVMQVVCFKEDEKCPKWSRMEMGRSTNCTIEFQLAARYEPSVPQYLSTKGEMVERYFLNRLLQKFNFL